MATTPIQFDFPSGQTLTLDLYAATNLASAVATGKSCTEVAGTGSYSCDVTEALTGLHKAIIEVGGARVGAFFVDLADTTADAFQLGTADKQAHAASTIVKGTVDAGTLTPTTTQFECDDITEATADHFNGRTVIFTSGVLIRQAAIITDYSLEGGNGRFTVSRDPDTSVPLTEAPGDNDTLIIV